MSKTTRPCQNPQCGQWFTARLADVARGWALYCSKSCAARAKCYKDETMDDQVNDKPPREDRPAPEVVKAARMRAGLTQQQAADLIYSKLRTWQDWESDACNTRMHPVIWKAFKHLAGLERMEFRGDREAAVRHEQRMVETMRRLDEPRSQAAEYGRVVHAALLGDAP